MQYLLQALIHLDSIRLDNYLVLLRLGTDLISRRSRQHEDGRTRALDWSYGRSIKWSIVEREPRSERSLHGPLAICVGFLVSLGLVGCGDSEVVGAAVVPKAVSVVTLKTGVPRNETLVAGVVEPYRRSDVSFDVSGLLVEVIDLGEAAEGPQFDGSGELLLDAGGRPVREGAVLAMLDPTRYEQEVTAAELSLASTDRQIDALLIELKEVIPARIENAKATVASAAADVVSARESVTAAESELELAKTTVERDRVLIESGAIAQSVLDQSESSFRTASASLAQAQSSLDASLQSERSADASLSETQGDLRVREADLASLRASRDELENALGQARTDLASCVLRAPFQGRVTNRYVERGSYANAGTAVLELTMETAIKVVITVSADEERRLALGSRLPVYASMPGDKAEAEPVLGTVFEKASVADTGTRTFRIGLILPNPVVGVGGSASAESFASVSDLFPVLALPGNPDSAMFVNVASIFDRDGEPHVLALPRRTGTSAPGNGVEIPRAVPVELTDEWAQFDKWTLRRVLTSGDLQPGDALVLNPEPSDESGVRIGSMQYAFRPGDVVRVGVDAALPAEGFWLPAAAIVSRTGNSLVFAVDDGVASEVLVDVLGTSGGYRRISAPALREGQSVVVRGMQYLSDGDVVMKQSETGLRESDR